MKVLALSCSPSRKRNSDTMLDHFILGIREVPDMEVEKIYLEDIPINAYRFENSLGPEQNETEFKKLTEKIRRDIRGLVIASPTYNFSVPAHLKNFIDRIRFFSLDFKNKTDLGQPSGKLGYLRMYFLVSGGTPTWAEHILFFAFPLFWLRGVFLYMGAKVLGGFYSGDVRTFENKKILKKCFKKGKRYALRIRKQQGQGLLENIFWRPPEKTN